jgi:hypothetical protein
VRDRLEANLLPSSSFTAMPTTTLHAVCHHLSGFGASSSPAFPPAPALAPTLAAADGGACSDRRSVKVILTQLGGSTHSCIFSMGNQ